MLIRKLAVGLIIGAYAKDCKMTIYDDTPACPIGKIATEITETDCAKAEACCWHGSGCYRETKFDASTVLSRMQSAITALNLNGFDRAETEKGVEAMKKVAAAAAVSEDDDTAQNAITKKMGSWGGMLPTFGGSSALPSFTSPSFASSFTGFAKPAYTSVSDSLSAVPSCPIKMPLCQRDPCQVDNPDLNTDAYGCLNVKGCCFDLNLWLHQKWFGIYTGVPTCYRSIKSPIFYQYVNQFTAWRPEWSNLVSAKLQQADLDDPDLWPQAAQCPHHGQWAVRMSTEIFQRYSFIVRSLGSSGGAGGVRYGTAYNADPRAMMMMTIGTKITSNLQESTMTIVRRLSGNCGWDGISRFESQMNGCCWMEDEAGEGRCARHFKIDDYQDDNEFMEAITKALMLPEGDEEEEDETAAEPELPGWGAPRAPPSGGFPGFGFAGKRKRRSPQFSWGGSTGGAGFGTTGFPTTGFGGAGGTAGFAPSSWPSSAGGALPGFGATGTNPLAALAGAAGGNPLAALASGAGFTGMNPLAGLDMSDPTAALAASMLMASKDDDAVSDSFEAYKRSLKFQQVQQYTDQQQPEQCSAINPERRQACSSFSGDLNVDAQMCIARGCCFDTLAWSKQEDEAKAAEEAKKSDDVPWGRGVRPPSPADDMPFSFRGKRSTDGLVRSVVNIPKGPANPFNPFLPMIPAEVCTWDNAFDGGSGLESMEEYIKPCCKQVSCYHADTDAQWASWSGFNECSATCGGGVKVRSRDCINNNVRVENNQCRGSGIEKQACANTPCPIVGPWGSWSSCTATCGVGVKNRQRRCSIEGRCT